MRFVIKNIRESISTLARKIGYFYLKKDEAKKEMSFIQPMEISGYPRFHLYLKIENQDWIFNLHLDQKRPIYEGTPAHSGEYEGEVIEKEAERIKQILQK